MNSTIQQKKRSDALGPLYIFVAAAVFSVGGLVIKLVDWNPMAINGARNAVAACITFVYIRAIRRKLRLTPAVALGAVAFFSTCALFVMANKMTTAANAIVLQYTSPVFIILFSWLFLRQKPRWRDILTCGVVFGGILCFFFDSLSGGRMLGNLLALAAGLSYAVVFMSNIIPGGDAISSFFFGQLISAAVGLPFLFAEPVLEPKAVMGVVLLGMILGVPYIFMSIGLKTTPPVAANLLSAIEPVLNPVWVALFYGEKISPLGIVGFMMVLGSVVIYNILNQRPVRKAQGPDTAVQSK